MANGRDGFGFGLQQPNPREWNANNIIKDAILVWDRLIDDKGPMGIQKDQMQWAGRANQLMEDDGFRNFINADTIEEKVIALRDAGLGPNKQMTDEELGQFLMTHAPSGLTEDPNVSEEAIETTEKEYPALIFGERAKANYDEIMEGDHDRNKARLGGRGW